MSGMLHLAQAQSNRGPRGRKKDFPDAERLVRFQKMRRTTVSQRMGRKMLADACFHGPVTFHNQAIATDNAIQNIERIGDTTGASLKEVAHLFQQSEDLTPRQVKEGLAGIEALALEVQKPEDERNWKSVLRGALNCFRIVKCALNPE